MHIIVEYKNVNSWIKVEKREYKMRKKWNKRWDDSIIEIKLFPRFLSIFYYISIKKWKNFSLSFKVIIDYIIF